MFVVNRFLQMEEDPLFDSRPDEKLSANVAFSTMILSTCSASSQDHIRENFQMAEAMLK